MPNLAPDGCPTERYLRYAPRRDAVIVLGAGASHPDGVPLQEHLLPLILSEEIQEIAGSIIGRQVRRFILDNFYVSPATAVYPKLEAVFGFLDHFIQQQESLSATYPNTTLREIKENLIKIVHYIVDLRTEKRSPVYHRFWQAVQKHNRNVSIITLNYDTLLEQAFDILFRTFGLIDYCIPLMNYLELKALEDFSFWLNPREPILLHDNEQPRPIKIIKVHGSLNWKYCNCCNQTLLTPWDRKIDLNRGMLIGHTYPDHKPYDYYCPLDDTEFQTLILPPSYIKALQNPLISQLFSEASREIRVAQRIVFVGYSMSEADVHIKALFKKHLQDSTEVIVVNIKPPQELRPAYSALSSKVRFIQCSFEEMVSDHSIMETLLC